MNIAYKILIAIIALIVIYKFITPLLIGLLHPFGLIAVIILYVGVVIWLLGGFSNLP